MANLFSKACEYAIKAMVFVSKNEGDGNCVGVKKIVEGIDAPEHFIAKVLQELSRKGFINSVKGPNGGFCMTAEQKQVAIIDIVVSFDGEQKLTRCVLGLSDCSNENPCPMHFEIQRIKNEIIEMLENNTVADFNDLMLTKGAILKL